jgi:chromosome segregation ATPase
LTKNSDGKIDLSEAIRVFGEPSQRVNQLQTTDTQKLSEVHLLEQQVHILQKQLEIAQEREQFQREELKAKNGQLQAKDEQIESLQRLLGAPKHSNRPNRYRSRHLNQDRYQCQSLSQSFRNHSLNLNVVACLEGLYVQY